MTHKYGEFTENQMISCKKRMHSLVHWLLIYAEDDSKSIMLKDEELKNYFEKVQYKLNGFNELLLFPSQLVEIMALIESARLEYFGNNYNHKKFRKIILDAHDLIDKIPTE